MDLPRLMDLAAGIRELTTDARAFGELPAFLAQALGLDHLILAVIRDREGEEPQIVSLAGSARTLMTADEQLRFHMNIIELSRLPAGAPEAGDVGAARLAESDPAAAAGEPRQIVLNRRLHDTQRLTIIVRQAPGAAPLVATALESLHLAANCLARNLAVLHQWSSYPHGLGEPFDRLTEREWVVLCGLNSEDGEKQLADHLNLSPHTLHSHIKSIYRKTGVQGRLPLLQKFHKALREFRLRQMAPAPVGSRAAG